MRILYVGMKYDYGFPERGLSFEHWNFFHTLESLGHDLLYFDFKTLHDELGHARMNEHLWALVKKECPDLLFSVLFEAELDRDVLRKISEDTPTTTVNWFADDHWRFETFSRHWAPCFNWVVTTADSALPKYRAIGYQNVIKSQWGFNHFLYRDLGLPLAYDVTFVGQPHGNRRGTVDAIRRRGIDLQVWGTGWESGRIEQDAMIRVFNQSRVNLNLSNASSTGTPMSLPRLTAGAIREAGRALEHFSWGRRIKAWRRSVLQARAAAAHYPEQIKARNFEIPGCGGFQLTGWAENLDEYFEIGKEVVCFESDSDLIEKIAYYLEHEDERRAIAQAAHQRALAEHTYERRFQQIFKAIGFDVPLG